MLEAQVEGVWISYVHLMEVHGLGVAVEEQLVDTTRMALGKGCLDLDLVLMALYVIGYNNDKCFCSPEPLGPGGDPYPQMYGRPDPEVLDKLVEQTALTFYEREEEILTASDDELMR